ncbi:hypothetical protein [Hoeflea sp.]|uniref:hypothetical protein n=1 Tax=Hoeflea sp. TaxID=1940281 RepID=UPI003B011C6E
MAKNNCFTNGEPLYRIKTVEEQEKYVIEFFSRIQPLTRATGFKIAPYQLVDRLHMIKTLRQVGVRILLVTRRDILKVAISQIRRAALEKITETRHGRPIANLFDAADRPAAVTVDCEALLHQIDQNMREREASIWIAESPTRNSH